MQVQVFTRWVPTTLPVYTRIYSDALEKFNIQNEASGFTCGEEYFNKVNNQP